MKVHKRIALSGPVLLAAAMLTLQSGPASAGEASNGTRLQQLQAAKAADWAGARDPSVSSIRRGTFVNQMDKADRAILELEHGRQPAQAELDDALWVPPKHITPEERAKLIAQLKQARMQDERNEQHMLNDLAWSRSASPADTSLFDSRKAEIDRVIENLEIDAPVRWSAIHEALQVPATPY